MGAWSHRIFDDDVTLDCLAELAESEDIISDMQNYLTDAIECAEDYLDYDAGAYGLAAACMIDAKLNGLDIEFLSDGCAEEDIATVMEKLDSEDVSPLRADAASAVRAVAAENSELRELWEENDECYPLVMAAYRKLIERLETL